MHYFRRFFCVLLLAFATTIPSTAWAVDAPKAPEAPGMGDYVIPMAVVLLGLVLGFIVVLKPANRRERAKPAGYEVKAEKNEGH